MVCDEDAAGALMKLQQASSHRCSEVIPSEEMRFRGVLQLRVLLQQPVRLGHELARELQLEVERAGAGQPGPKEMVHVTDVRRFAWQDLEREQHRSRQRDLVEIAVVLGVRTQPRNEWGTVGD